MTYDEMIEELRLRVSELESGAEYLMRIVESVETVEEIAPELTVQPKALIEVVMHGRAVAEAMASLTGSFNLEIKRLEMLRDTPLPARNAAVIIGGPPKS